MAKKFILLAVLFIVSAIAESTTDTTATPGTSVSVATEAPGTISTEAPDTNSTDAPSTAPVSTATQVPPTESSNPCDPNPCFDGSTCEAHFNMTYVCLCPPGEIYNSVTCQKVKVFPGQLMLDITYDPKMEDKRSAEFLNASLEIISALQEIFKNGTSSVLELRKAETNTDSKKSSDKVDASIEIAFEITNTITEKDVQEKLEAASNDTKCTNCVLKGSTFSAKDLCSYPKSCDSVSTTCKSKDGTFNCSCSPGYIETTFSDKICFACPSGKKAEGGECKNCPPLRTGFNCQDNGLLVAVIVASLLGGLMLISLIVLPIVIVKMKKKSSKTSKAEDFGKPYVSHSVAKSQLANSSVHNGQPSSFNPPASGMAANPGVPRFPRATSGARDNGSNLEMMPGNSRQNLISAGKSSWINDDEDDKFSFGRSRPQSNYYEQNRPQQNPYAQSRGVNPYAQSQGNSNPYYVPDDDRWSR